MRTKLTATLLLGGVLALGGACSGEKVGPPPAPPVNWASLQAKPVVDAGDMKATERERQIANAYTKALGAVGFASMPALLNESAHMAFGRQSAHGREAVIKMHDALFGAFDQRALTVNRVWLTDTSQAIEWTMTGVQAREWMGLAATQKPVAIKGLALVWTQDEGTIAELHVMFDVGSVKAQLAGTAAAPSPAGAPQVFEETEGPEETSNVAAVNTWLDALEMNMHDGDKPDGGKALVGEAAYLSLMTSDVELYTQGRAQPQRGQEEARGYFRAIHRAIAQLDTPVTNAWGVASYVVVEYSIGGQQVGPLGTIPLVRDRLVTLNVVDVVELRGGKIARVWRYDNPDEVTEHPRP